MWELGKMSAFNGFFLRRSLTLFKYFFMDINPQYTFDNNGNPVGVFISIKEWEQLSKELHIGIPMWQQQALDAELDAITADPGSLLKWDDIKSKVLS
jgi:hypothetical protein